MTRPGSYDYSIDSHDRLIAVGDSWLSFASENDAPELTREKVIGRRIWDFIAGDPTREIYRLLLARVRGQHAGLSLPIRCDSPDLLRFMQIRLSPGERSGVDIRVVLDRVERRDHLRMLDRLAPRADYAFPMCSFCKRLFAFGAWLEPEEAIARLGWLESRDPPEIEEDVCGECARERRAQLDGDGASP